MLFEYGTIRWFNSTTGYGFLTSDANVDVFLHARSLPVGMVPQRAT
jgi:cold shock CspA family protein